MTNPVGSKEQREELRRFLLGQIRAPEGSYEAVLRGTSATALDGLDIAEEMAARLDCWTPRICSKARATKKKCLACQAVRRWQAWKRGDTIRLTQNGKPGYPLL